MCNVVKKVCLELSRHAGVLDDKVGLVVGRKLRTSMLADPIEQMRESTQIVFEWKYAPI